MRGGWLVLLGWILTACRPDPGPRAGGAFGQEAYVWQREWTPTVGAAVREHGGQFAGLVVLGGEIAWTAGRGSFVRGEWDAAALRAAGVPVGIALRVGSFSGPFDPDAAPAGYVRRMAREMVEEFRRAGLEPRELQIDFDCAESRLDGYRRWIEAVRADAGALPVVITALPSWLKRREFAGLARAAGAFVLQVHSVARPKSSRDTFELCDPVAARRWVEQAAAVGVPFRVALPTYGYLVAFDSAGHYLGASAEGPPPVRPADAVLREIGADPVRMAQLIGEWSADRPAAMHGVIWYRLPVADDRLNWRWPTLATAMSGRAPLPRLSFSLTHPEPALVELRVANEGTADHTGPAGARLRWRDARLVAQDGIRGFAAETAGETEILFTNAICRLPAGEVRTIGWLRFSTKPSLELLP